MKRLATIMLATVLAGLAPPAPAQSVPTLAGTWVANVAEEGSGPGGLEYDRFSWVRRLRGDGTAQIEARFYRDDRVVLRHAEEGEWGVEAGAFWFRCARVLREGAMVPCDRRAEYQILAFDPTTLRYRAKGSERIYTMSRAADDFRLPDGTQ